MKPLSLWMTVLLRFAGVFNLLAGAGMICLYHEGFRMLGVEKPATGPARPGDGHPGGALWRRLSLVAANPVENRNILLLGFWSKALSSLAALWYVTPWAAHPLPLWFAGVVFFADMIYLPPFYVILRRLSRLARG